MSRLGRFMKVEGFSFIYSFWISNVQCCTKYSFCIIPSRHCTMYMNLRHVLQISFKGKQTPTMGRPISKYVVLPLCAVQYSQADPGRSLLLLPPPPPTAPAKQTLSRIGILINRKMRVQLGTYFAQLRRDRTEKGTSCERQGGGGRRRKGEDIGSIDS